MLSIATTTTSPNQLISHLSSNDFAKSFDVDGNEGSASSSVDPTEGACSPVTIIIQSDGHIDNRNDSDENNHRLAKAMGNKQFTIFNINRAAFAWWVVACHVAVTLKFVGIAEWNEAQKHNDQSLDIWSSYVNELKSAAWPALAVGSGHQVDVLFGIAGFLMTWNMLVRESQHAVEHTHVETVCLQIKHGLLTFIKRIPRLWSATVVQLLLLVATGEFQAFADATGVWNLLERAFTFSSGGMPPSLNCSWSSLVDLIAVFMLIMISIGLSYAFPLYGVSDEDRRRNSHQRVKWSFLLIFISLLPKIIVFLFSSTSFSYVSLSTNPNLLSSMLPLFVSQFSLDNFSKVYSQHFHYSIIVPIDENKTNVLTMDYIVFYMRWTPFFIGSYFAYWFHHHHLSQYGMENQDSGILSKIRRWIKLIFAVVMFLFPLLIAFSNNSNGASTTEVPFAKEFFVSVLLRSLYSMSTLYLMIRFELPSSHPEHIPGLETINKLMSHTYLPQHLSWLSPWLPSLQHGEMAFMIYACHPKILNEVSFRWLPIKELVGSIGWNPFLHFLIWSSCAIVITAKASRLAYDWVEKPINQWLKTIDLVPSTLITFCLPSKDNEFFPVLFSLLSRPFRNFFRRFFPTQEIIEVPLKWSPIAMIESFVMGVTNLMFFALLVVGALWYSK